MSLVAACTVVLLAQTPFEIEPEDPTADQTIPSLACDAFGCSVAWSRGVTAGGRIRERWLSFDGGLGDATNVPLLGGFTAPTVQGSGAWDGGRLYFITPNGVSGEQRLFSVFTPNPFDTLDSANATTLNPQYESGGVASFAHTDALGLIAYGAVGGAALMPQIFFQPVLPTGALLGPSIHINQTENAVRDPSVVEHDGTFYVLYFDRSDSTQYDPFLTVWNPDAGFVIDHLMLLNDPLIDEDNGALVVAGDHLIVAWTNKAGTDQFVFVSPMQFDGGLNPNDPARFVITASNSPMLTWVNGYGLFAFQDIENGTISASVYRLNGDIFDINPLFTAVSASAMDLSLAQPDEEHAFFAYTVDDGGSIRTFVQAFDFGAPDASFPSDAGMTDSGFANDAGAGDAGPLDAGTPDGGPAGSDGGSGTPINLALQCGCGAFDPFPLLLLAAVLVKLRRVGPRIPQR